MKRKDKNSKTKNLTNNSKQKIQNTALDISSLQLNIQNSTLPEGWVWVRLGEMCDIYPGYGFPKNLQGKESGKYPFYKVGDISKNVALGYKFLEFCENYIDDDDLNKLKAKPYPKGTIVFAKIGEALKLNRRAILKKEGLVDNNAIGVKAVENICCNNYFFYFLNTVKLEDYSRATTVPSVRKSDIEMIPLPLPPLPEQHRIVAKIEELFTKLDAGIEALKKAKEQIKRYRQAVLKYAFEGKLTEEWRVKNQPQETAEELLEKIKEERKKKLGKKYKARSERSRRELPPVDTSELPELPEGWVWVRLGEIANNINPGFPSGKHNKENMGLPHLRPMNINLKGEIDLSNIKYVQPEKEYDKLIKGDILFNNTNSPELLGKTCYIKENTNWAYSNHMTRIRVNENLLNPAWVSYCLHTLFLNGFFKLNCTHHVNQASINTTFLSERVYIPLPPLPEQHRIVEEIERRFSVADEVEKAIDNSLKQAERLRQSILKNAFEGKLVPQDPNDEPAEKLLERIKNVK